MIYPFPDKRFFSFSIKIGLRGFDYLASCQDIISIQLSMGKSPAH